MERIRSYSTMTMEREMAESCLGVKLIRKPKPEPKPEPKPVPKDELPDIRPY